MTKVKTTRNRENANRMKCDTDRIPADPEEEVDDGYYDDELPPDIDSAKEGRDKAMIKQVLLVGLVVFVIISLRVALLYVL